MADTDTTITEATATEATEHVEQPTDATEQPLGDAGKHALDSERKARREAERQAKELAAKVAQFEEQGKSEAEKLAARYEAEKARADQLAARLDKATKADAIRAAAAKAGAVDADVIAALVADQVTVEDGEAVGADEAVRQLANSKPHLFDTRPAGYGDGTPKRGGTGRTAADIFAAQTGR